MSDALVLLAHGSSDPEWGAQLEALARRCAAQTGLEVALAFLERSEPDLGACVRELAARGFESIVVCAVLLSGGGRHFKTDVPEAIAALRAELPGLGLRLVPVPLGTAPEVVDGMARAAARLAASALAGDPSRARAIDPGE